MTFGAGVPAAAGLIRVPNIGRGPILTISQTSGAGIPAASFGTATAPGTWLIPITLTNPQSLKIAFMNEAKGFRNWSFFLGAGTYAAGGGTFPFVGSNGVYVFGTADQLTADGTTSNWGVLPIETTSGGASANPMQTAGTIIEFDKPLVAVAFSCVGFTGTGFLQIFAEAVP
jgi:hypothetical protein